MESTALHGSTVSAAPAELPQPVLCELEGATLVHGGDVLLERVSWAIHRGEQWAVTGPNGAGKSLLLRGLRGELSVTEGALRHPFLADDPRCRDSIFGVLPRGMIELVSSELGQRWRQTIGAFHQVRWHATMDHGVAVAELFEPQRLESINPFRVDAPPVDPAQLRNDSERAIGLAGIESLLHRRVLELSSGELKKVMLARALARAPKLLLLDDPFTGLDEGYRQRLRQLIGELGDRGVCVVLATRRLDEIPESTTHVLVLADRHVAMGGPRAAVLGQIGAAHDASRTPVRAETSRSARLASVSSTAPAPVAALASVQVSAASSASAAAAVQPPVIAMHEVRVAYGDIVILDRIEWTVNAGERWAVVGPNGAGKSTLLSLITGDNLLAYANDVRLFGRRRGSGDSIWDLRAHIGFVGPDLDLHMPKGATCRDVVLSGTNGTLGLPLSPSTTQRERAAALLASLGVADAVDAAFGAIAQATRRLVLLARALVNEPHLLVLDEPCQGLDSSHVTTVRDAVDHCVAAQQVSLLYVTHDPGELPRSITHVLALASGRIVRQGPRSGRTT